MRILHVITGLGVGGAEATLLALARGLRDMGFEQRVLALTGGPNAERLSAAGIPVDNVEARGIGLAFALPRMLGIVRAFRPDVVQGWMYHGDLAALATRPFLRAGTRIFWGIRASDMDLDRYGRLIGMCARLSNRPDAIIANSRAGADAHMARGYRPRRLEVVANGIDVTRFSPNAEVRAQRRALWGLSPDTVVVAHVARVDPMKDHPTLLTALAEVPDVQLLLAGSDTETLNLPANARALGRLPDPESLYRAADIIVSSSAFGEGFPNVIAEGMACGCIPIATRSGDSEHIVGDTGDIVAPRDARAIAAAIRREAARPAPERQKRAAAARDRIVSTFAYERMLAAYAELYRPPPPPASA